LQKVAHKHIVLVSTGEYKEAFTVEDESHLRWIFRLKGLETEELSKILGTLDTDGLCGITGKSLLDSYGFKPIGHQLLQTTKTGPK